MTQDLIFAAANWPISRHEHESLDWFTHHEIEISVNTLVRSCNVWNYTYWSLNTRLVNILWIRVRDWVMRRNVAFIFLVVSVVVSEVFFRLYVHLTEENHRFIEGPVIILCCSFIFNQSSDRWMQNENNTNSWDHQITFVINKSFMTKYRHQWIT